jgi:CDP-glycerol glycerophosphotransferase
VPKLSVVVPFHNVERYIEECLGSLRAQTFEDFEVVLVDDGSTDASRATADRFVAADRRFRVVSQEQSGAGPARNLGVRHAEGEYLAFADSDDLVAPRAYSLLVDTMRATRSDIAAGNAGRFGARGVRPSWTHAEPFARTRLGTSLASHPSLIRDRMVWNKVFRRSFWDENQFEYAAISYQDYPVALAANLRAGAIDVLHPRVYYWRDRPTGDSTTQQVARMSNARDRVTSAHMVLDLLDRADVPEARALAHAYLVDVDLVALATALPHVPDVERGELLGLAQTLALRLDIQPHGRTQRLARLIHEGWREGDPEFVGALATWRRDGDRHALWRALARHGRLRDVPRVRAAIAPRRRRGSLLRPRALKTRVTTIERGADDLRVSARVILRHRVAARAHVAARLTDASGHRVRLHVDAVARDGDGMLVTISIPGPLVAPLPRGPLAPDVTVTLGPVRWRGRVRLPVRSVPPIWPIEDGGFLQPARVAGSWFLWLVPVPDPVVIEAVRVEGTSFVLTLSEPEGELVVSRPYPRADLVAPVRGGRAVIDLAELQATDMADSPVSRAQSRAIGFRPSPAAAETAAIPGAGTEEPEPVRQRWAGQRAPYLAVPLTQTTLGDEIFSIAAYPSGHARVDRVPAPAAESGGGLSR